MSSRDSGIVLEGAHNVSRWGNDALAGIKGPPDADVRDSDSETDGGAPSDADVGKSAEGQPSGVRSNYSRKRAPESYGARWAHTPLVTAALFVLVLVQSLVIAIELRTTNRTTFSAGVRLQPAAAAPMAASERSSDTVAVARPSPTAVGEPLPAAPALSGTPVSESRLLVRSEPRGATVTIDGRRRGTTPVSISDLSVGTHHMRLENGGSRVEQDVTLADGTTNSVLVAMNAAGWLDVRAPFDMTVLEGGRMLGTSADGALSLRAGSHRLELRNDSVGYRNTVDVSVRGGDLTTLRPAIPDAVVQVNAQPWATVLVDGTPVGETPLGNLHVALGPHEVRFRHPQLGEQVRQVMVSADVPVHLSVDLRR